jgi:hypothetical protein
MTNLQYFSAKAAYVFFPDCTFALAVKLVLNQRDMNDTKIKLTNFQYEKILSFQILLDKLEGGYSTYEELTYTLSNELKSFSINAERKEIHNVSNLMKNIKSLADHLSGNYCKELHDGLFFRITNTKFQNEIIFNYNGKIVKEGNNYFLIFDNSINNYENNEIQLIESQPILIDSPINQGKLVHEDNENLFFNHLLDLFKLKCQESGSKMSFELFPILTQNVSLSFEMLDTDDQYFINEIASKFKELKLDQKHKVIKSLL